MTDAPALSVVVLSWNTKELTLACLQALFAESPRHAREVIVVDNGSTDGSQALARRAGARVGRSAEIEGRPRAVSDEEMPADSQGVCHMIRGVLGGLGDGVFGARVDVRESECVATGGDRCSFHVEAVLG